MEAPAAHPSTARVASVLNGLRVGRSLAAPGRALPLAVAVLAGAAAVIAGLALTGAAVPSLLFDPGPVVRWGLPLVTMIAQLAGALTIGVLVLTAVALPAAAPGRGPAGASRAGGSGRTARAAAYPGALTLVSVTGAVWTLATVIELLFQYSQISGTQLTDPAFGEQMAGFVRQTDPGRGLLVTIATAALVTTIAAGSGSLGVTGLLAVLSLVALVPPALAGHASGSNDHETAVTSLGLHLVGVCVWVGGLVGLVLLAPRLGDALPTAVRRYSVLAGWAFVLVGVSGVINAAIRVPEVSGLASRYGVLLELKAGALAVLGMAGLLHRRRAVPALAAGRPRAFARLAAGEVVVMAVAFGLAAALAASPPPSSGRPTLPTLVESVTGYPLPPPPTPLRWLTQWQPDLLWLVVSALGVGLYLGGVRRLRARGDGWFAPKTISWLIGIAGLVYVTCGPPAVYGRVLFSAHMVGHMTLSMLVPIFLVLGEPATLALRALPPRGDGSRGPREWLLAALESRFARVLSFPPVAAFLFAGSLVFFYFSPLFGLALRTHVGHELMHVHFLLAGYLFAWVLIGLDPGPHRVSQPLRLITLLAAMAFHAFFGVALLSGGTVLEAGYFGGLGRTWGPALLSDQRLGGGVAWGIGDVPAIVMAVIIAIQWAMSDDREARRLDRAADRDGDAELNAYNAMLARLAETGRDSIDS
jgi:cytochrome c oxidase assembly factor CtaG/putative copper export protein